MQLLTKAGTKLKLDWLWTQDIGRCAQRRGQEQGEGSRDEP